MKIGDRVQVFDRYSHAIPVFGVIFGGPATDGAFGVKLETTNNPQIPIGSERWYFACQLAPAPRRHLDPLDAVLAVQRAEIETLRHELAVERDLRQAADAVLNEVRKVVR